MNIVTWIIILTAIAGVGGTGLGGLIGAILKRDSTKVVSLLLSFAGGVMLAVVCFDLIIEATNPEGAEKPISIWLVILGILLGYAVIFILNYLIDKTTNHEIKHIGKNHPKTADNLDELIHADHLKQHRILRLKDKQSPANKKETSSFYQLFIAGVVMACAIALHNLPEGMVIGASYAGMHDNNLFTGGGLIIGIVIGLHNIPEGMAVSVPLITGGMRRAKAVFVTAMTGAPTIIGAVIGYFLGTISHTWLSVSLSFASGAMLYVVFGELLPEAILMWRSKMPAFFMLIGMLTGLLIIHI